MSKTHVIDGVTYVEVARKAEVGDKIIDLLSDDGEFRYCINNDRWDDDEGIGVDTSLYIPRSWKDGYGLCHHQYRVLQPLEEPTQASPDVLDMLANLARRVNSLEKQLAATQRNLETFAEQTENNSEDIRELDSRTQIIDAINKYYAEGSR